MCAVVLCKTEKKKRDPHPTQTDITVNAESTGHRPTTDLGPHDIHPKVQNPIPNSPYSPDTPLPTYTSPDTSPDTPRHCVVSAPRHCGVSAPTRQRPDTHSNSAPTPPRHCPTLSPRDTLQHCRAQRRVESPVRGTAGTRNDAAWVCLCVRAADLIAPSDRFCEFCMHLVNQFGRALVACRDAKVMGSF